MIVQAKSKPSAEPAYIITKEGDDPPCICIPSDPLHQMLDTIYKLYHDTIALDTRQATYKE